MHLGPPLTNCTDPATIALAMGLASRDGRPEVARQIRGLSVPHPPRCRGSGRPRIRGMNGLGTSGRLGGFTDHLLACLKLGSGGAAVGTTILPGWGTVVGGAGGCITGGFLSYMNPEQAANIRAIAAAEAAARERGETEEDYEEEPQLPKWALPAAGVAGAILLALLVRRRAT